MSSGQVDAWAEALLGLVFESEGMQDLGVGRDEARALGEEIYGSGGFALMREVALRARDLGLLRGQRFALGYIERWWSGIGPWQA
jgi:hypothetical protein